METKGWGKLGGTHELEANEGSWEGRRLHFRFDQSVFAAFLLVVRAVHLQRLRCHRKPRGGEDEDVDLHEHMKRLNLDPAHFK